MLDPDSDTVTELTDEHCWSLLGHEQLGRLATAVGQDIDIFPLTYRLDGQSLYFRTSAGRKLAATSINGLVALEIDGYDEVSAWSVVAKGVARHLTGSAEIDVAEALDIRSWLPTAPHEYVRIDVTDVSGRTFRFAPDRAPVAGARPPARPENPIHHEKETRS